MCKMNLPPTALNGEIALFRIIKMTTQIIYKFNMKFHFFLIDVFLNLCQAKAIKIIFQTIYPINNNIMIIKRIII